MKKKVNKTHVAAIIIKGGKHDGKKSIMTVIDGDLTFINQHTLIDIFPFSDDNVKSAIKLTKDK